MPWINPRSGALPVALQTRLGRIAYFGASVTAQKQGYRPALHLKLVQHFGRPHLPINAGVGGIGMAGGVFLMDDLVLARRPDFCFIEFSTADYSGALPLHESAAALEGALRKLAEIHCPAGLLHLYRDDADYSQTPPVVEAFDAVAAHYGVPSLHVGAYLAGEFASGLIHKASMLKDVVHLTAQGAAWVAEAVFEAVVGMWASSPGPHSPATAPFYLKPYQATHILPAPAVIQIEDEALTLGRFGGQYDFVQVREGQGFTVACHGTLAGMLVVVGPDSGVIDAAGQRIQLWDRWCTYERLQAVLFWPQFPPPGTPVRICLTDMPVDYSAAHDPALTDFGGKKSLKVIGFLVKK
jgi:lysophospholipase L1-like esterase